MKIVKKKIIGCYEILPQIHDDKRGLFVKTFHAPTFKKFGLQVSFKEQYYSTSSKNVIRGLHFQIPPKDHAKLIYCILGEVVDIVLVDDVDVVDVLVLVVVVVVRDDKYE